MSLRRVGEDIQPKAEIGVQPGPLIESMQTELQRMLDLKQTFGALYHIQEEAFSEADLDDVLSVAEEAQRTPQEELADMLERRSEVQEAYGEEFITQVGYTAFLLGSAAKLIQREKEAWAKGAIAREWVGKYVTLTRPTPGEVEDDERWSKRFTGPPYRAYVRSGYSTGNMQAESDHSRPSLSGVVKWISLNYDGGINLGFNAENGVIVKEIFSITKEPDTGNLLALPRIAIVSADE